MSTFYFVLFIIGGLLVLGYPVILFVNIVSLSGHKPKTTPRFTTVMMKIFLWSTTLYPVTYFMALYKYRNTPAESHYIWAGLILVHLLFVFISYKGWTSSEKKARNNKLTSIRSKKKEEE